MATSTVAEKPTYTFAAGYVTEQTPVNVVPGSALDMENFEIEVAGALRRRKAIAQEDSGATVAFSGSSLPSIAVVVHHTWNNAGGTPGRTMHAMQMGTTILLVPEGDTLSASGTRLGPINLLSYKTSSATSTQVLTSPVSFTSARTHLVVTGTYIQPFYISLAGNDITPAFIDLYIRDFVGIEDGVELTTQPTVESASHTYNLKNRGWDSAEIADYLADTVAYPAKNMIPWMGYLRTVNVGTQEGYGTKAWNSAKLQAEAFRGVSAAQGSLLLNPFNTTVAVTGSGSGSVVTNNIDISTWTRTGQTVDVTLTGPHGISTGDIVNIIGNAYSWRRFPSITTTMSLDGNHTVTVTGADTFRFTLPNDGFALFLEWVDQFISLGTAVVENTVSGSGGVSSTEGYITDYRPTAVAWFAGRVFYAGCQYHKIADTVFFSQIVEDEAQYGRCYQRNDPTAENFNALLPTDGGTIKIPGLHSVLGMQILGASLLIFSKAGVWEIRGGQGGFTATDYLIRKVTDAEVTSAVGICRTDAGIIFATKRGLFAANGDTNSGLITAGNMTAARVNTYWNTITDAALGAIRVVYDDSKQRVYTLIAKSTSHVSSPGPLEYTEALVLDFRVSESGAFYKLSLPYGGTGSVAGALALENSDNSASNKKIKFVWRITGTGNVSFLDMDHTDYTDESGDDHPPFVKVAYDPVGEASGGEDGRVSGDWHKRKQAGLYVYMFMGRTETGYEEIDDELYHVNPGSVIIQGRWEWSDSSNSGKWTNPQQAYRPRNLYTPYDAENNGYPVVVTRNKIRGSGRALSLYVYGEQAKDAHILGWLAQYGVT